MNTAKIKYIKWNKTLYKKHNTTKLFKHKMPQYNSLSHCLEGAVLDLLLLSLALFIQCLHLCEASLQLLTLFLPLLQLPASILELGDGLFLESLCRCVFLQQVLGLVDESRTVTVLLVQLVCEHLVATFRWQVSLYRLMLQLMGGSLICKVCSYVVRFIMVQYNKNTYLVP